ncbi:MAG: hypothetical protein WC317_02665 [Candidatus Omnitrophota bacterium]|jgi:hypothetical protein
MRTTAGYRIGNDNEFIIENYNYSKAFSSFLPGIAGVDGIPMWVFYVNRNQAVCSLGIESKDRAMMEFLPANFAYQLVGTQGFRTFIKIIGKNGFTLYEPFRVYEKEEGYIPSQVMAITPYSVTLREVHEKLGMSVEVRYCNVVQEPFPGLIRQVEIKNISGRAVKIELLDGMPQVIPFGMDDSSLKKMKYLVKSFSYAENLGEKIPYFHIRTTHEDGPEVAMVKRGHYYACVRVEGGKAELKRPLIDASQIFGIRKDMILPSRFNVRSKFIYDTKGELTSGEFSSAMCHEDAALKPSETLTLYCVCGTLDSVGGTKEVARALTADFAETQLKKNRTVIESIMGSSLVISEDEKFDRYSAQNFLDNVLRGGFPLTVTKDRSKVFYVYSRKHGDLERDYNQFYTSPTLYSQGDSNYRDVNQNRRNDTFFNPDVGMSNIINFINFIQMDGFNPQGVDGVTFIYKGDKKLLISLFGSGAEKMEEFFRKPFAPGDIFKFAGSNSIKAAVSNGEMLSKILERSDAGQNSRHIDGFWSDHWSYNMDLIDSFLAVYPDRRKELFSGRRDFTFHDSPYVVLPRQDKYVLWDGKPVQLGAVKVDEEKRKMIAGRRSEKTLVRKVNGKGDVYRTDLITKLLIIAVNKINSIGPDGCGIEMETDKPNWCDALNGLPGLFGSSSNETFELKRLITMISKNLGGKALELPEEAVEAIRDSKDALNGYLGGRLDDLGIWDKLTAIKENFRRKTRCGIIGRLIPVPADEISGYLALAAKRVQAAINKSFDEKTGLYSGYFINVPAEYEQITVTDSAGREVPKANHKGLPCIRVMKFNSRTLPLFLEAQVHALKAEEDRSVAARLHYNLMKSGLVDKKLKMFSVNASLEKEPYEIGRTKTFNPGWLENQSIWLHMEYKYLLELLKAGLYKDYYANFKDVLVPFLRPEVYGRSIFENSSFIAGSVHPDKKVHGQGFYARLSGSTAEFVHMWLIMMTGGRPFSLDANGKLVFSLSPVLKGGMFLKKDRKAEHYSPEGKLQKETVKKGTLKFMLLGSIPVTYINPRRKDIFGGGKGAKYALTLEDGAVKEFTGSVPEPYSALVRERKIKEIKMYLD